MLTESTPLREGSEHQPCVCVCVCVCVCRLSLVAVNGGYSPVVVHGLLIAVASLFAEHRP